MTDDTPAKPVSRRQRFEILRRDGHTCRYCGAHAPDVPLTVDHVIPRTLGGTNDPSNLVTACKDCNSGKSSTSPGEHVVADVDARAMEWAAAMARASEMRRQDVDAIDEEVAQVATYWDGWGSNVGGVPKADGWRSTLERFLAAGLDVADLNRLVCIAMESKAKVREKWRYFCGCCWKEIDRRQSLAATLVGTSPPEPDDDPWSNGTHMPSYNMGFDDGQSYGFDDGYRKGISDGRVEAEAAYEEGFRKGVNRLTSYVPPEDD